MPTDNGIRVGVLAFRMPKEMRPGGVALLVQFPIAI